jgi:2,4-dienoyl-CoA reductase (NADPH2)
VILQGSVVDVDAAEAALAEGACDGVEMTRAQIADADLAAKLAAGTPERIRPCIRCNQTCQVRDARNPLVTCVGDPSSGHEWEDPDWTAPAAHQREVLVVGAGPAGLEAARVASLRGHKVRVVERAGQIGGAVAVAGPGQPLVAWLAAECERLGVTIELGVADAAPSGAEVVVQCTGSQPGVREFDVQPDAAVLDVLEVRAGRSTLPANGTIVVFDPIGGPIGVALAEDLGDRAVLVTQDNIAGNELSRTGDLAPANVRLQQRGVRIERRTLLRAVRPGEVELEDRFTGTRRRVDAVALVDCGHRLPDAPRPDAVVRAGDCVAPRTIHEAILEGRRAAHGIG